MFAGVRISLPKKAEHSPWLRGMKDHSGLAARPPGDSVVVPKHLLAAANNVATSIVYKYLSVPCFQVL